MCVPAGFIRFQQQPAKCCYVHSTEPSGSEMTDQPSEYQNLKQHTLTSAQKMNLLLRTVRGYVVSVTAILFQASTRRLRTAAINKGL